MAKKITVKQRTKIWAKRKEIGLSIEQLRDIVEFASGQRSTKALTRFQAKVVIDIMEGKYKDVNTPLTPLNRWGKNVVLVPKNNSKVVGRFVPLASQRQLRYIRDLQREAEYDEDRLINFIRKKFKKSILDELTSGEIGVVKKVLENEIKKKKEFADVVH